MWENCPAPIKYSILGSQFRGIRSSRSNILSLFQKRKKKKEKRKKKKIIISSSLNSLFNFAFELSRDSSFVAVIFLCHQKLLFSWWCNFNHYCQYVYWFLSTFFIDCFGSALYFLCNKQNIDYEENAGIKFVSLLVMIRLSFHFFLLYVHFYLIFISLIYNL